MNELLFDVSGLGLVLRGMPETLASDLAALWAGFEGRPAGAPFLDVRVDASQTADDPRPFSAKTMRSSFSAGTAEFLMDEGAVRVPHQGPVAIRIGPTTPGKQLYAVINLMIAVFACRLPARGGAVIHGAGIVLDGRGFLLVGAEGAGKTTWAAIAHEAGARVLSDDVVLVDGASGRFELIASPFRAKEYGRPEKGRWPLAAVLGARHAEVPSLESEPPIRSRARLTANLTHAVDGLDHMPRLSAVVDAIVARVPSRVLAFRKDASYLELLRTLEV